MTKRILTIAFTIVCLGLTAQAQDKKPAPAPAAAVPGNMAAFKWETTVYDFGKIPKGKPVTAEFKFTNVGNVPLTLSNVQASCGCTTPDWTKDPVPPKKSGFIKATYNAAAVGPFSKNVTITANVESGQQILTIKGEVVE